MQVRHPGKIDSLYHTCLKERLLVFFSLLLPVLAAGQTIKFTDVTSLMKVPGWVTNGFSTYGHGAIWTDISGDSLPDLYIANAMRQANAKLPETLYISHAGAAYTEEDGARGISDMYGSTGTHGIIMADYDNDGDLDLFNATTDDRVRLYRNKGNGFFENFTNGATLASTRVTYEGYGTIGYGTRALVVFDADNDGDMDLYGTNWGPVEDIHEVPWVTPAQPNEFFINNGNGTFSNVTDRGCTPVNPSNEGTQGVTSIDIDEDGDMDIFVCHRNYTLLGTNPDGSGNFGRGATPAPNDLFLNDGNGSFTEASVRDRGLWSESNDCNGTSFADYDNDGDLDAFVVYTDEIRPKVRVLQNDGRGYFTNVSTNVVIEQWGFTPFIFDMDNDGDLDLFAPRTREKGRIYLNNGNGTYTLLSGTGVEIDMYDPRGGTIADMDNDGDLDVYYVDANKDAGPYFNRMFRNDTPSANRWLKIWGRGPKGDLGAFGSKIWLFEKGHMDDMTKLVGYKQIINGYGYLAQDDIVQHFGVALRDSVDIKIRMLDGTVLKTRLKSNTKHFFSKPASIAIVDGNSQSGMSGTMLPQPLRVVVLDAQGKAVAGAPVTFTVDISDGHFTESQPVYTDGRGYAQVTFTTGNLSGTRVITAATGSLSVPFAITVTNNGPAILTLLTGSGQSAYTGQLLADSIRVKVTNSAGVAQSGHPVRFEVTAGNGRIKPGDLLTLERSTDGAGIAAVAWQLGAVANTPQTLRIASSINGQPLSGSPFDVQATALERINLAGRPKNLISVSGDSQTGTAGAILPAPFIVQLVDSVGVGCPFYDILFQVTTGEGSLGGAQQQIVQTDNDGRASVFLQLGPATGVSNNHVSARHNGLARVVYFTASAVAAEPAILIKVDGDLQSGTPGFTLPKYLQARVTDAYGNAVAGQAVNFAIASTDGFVNDQKNVSVQTDSAGLAQVLLKLGATPGAYMVMASSAYNGISLTGSPLLFTATAVTEPVALQRVSADSTSGLAGQLLDAPLRVRVTDMSGYPVPNHPVTFWVRRGSGNLEGLPEITKLSDANGVAAVTPTLGSAYGAANNVFEAQSFKQGGLHLTGSPLRFYVSARKSMAHQIYATGGNTASAQAGEMLADPLAVLVLDKLQQAVAGVDVLFEVTKGSGTLGSGKVRSATVQSNTAGIAQISFRLGSELGDQAHTVRASANDGVSQLLNSPLTFTISAPYGQPDTSASTVTLNTPVVADGVSECVVRIRLVDGQGHAVPGERLTLQVNGDGCRITQPESVTDAAGEAYGIVSSTVAGRRSVRVYISSKGKYLKTAPEVVFAAGSPQRITLVSGDYQTGIIQSALEKPVIVQLEDFYANPVANAALEFIPAVGSGEVTPNQILASDAAGRAQVTWILGPSVGQQQMMVRATGTSVTRVITATANLPQQIQLEKAKGDGQFAAPGTVFPDSLSVRVVNDHGSPIYGVGVTFAVLQGSATLSTSSAVTSDRYGLARVRLAAGAVNGVVKVRAMAPSGDPVDFTGSITASVPALMAAVYGDSLTSEVGTTAYPLMVRITDSWGNPVANVPVHFEALSEGASVTDEMPVYTADDGQVAALVRLGTVAGPYRFQASSSHVDGSPVTFTLYAEAGPAADLVIQEGNQQTGRALQTLANPVKVRITDRFGNGVPGETVQFVPLSGGGAVSPASVVTDVSGLAAVQWALGMTGSQSLQAKCPDLPGKQLLLSAILLENLGPVIHAVDDTTVLETESLVFEVQAIDPDGGTVTLSAQNLPDGSTFDAVNSRLFVWRPDYYQQGTYAIRFTARDANGGETQKTVTVRVQNRNRPPSIIAYLPESFYYQVPTFIPVSFSVQAMDQDSDLLTYTWRLNGRVVGKKDTLTILTGSTLPAQFTLIVTVYDQSDSVSHAWSVQQATGVAEHGSGQLPQSNRLVQNYPNPFNPETTITCELAASQEIDLKIYNIAGQCIRTLYSGRAQAGYHRLVWNGRSDTGEPVSSGVYSCVLRGEGYHQTIKLVFLK
jgi:hypothetical protein